MKKLYGVVQAFGVIAFLLGPAEVIVILRDTLSDEILDYIPFDRKHFDFVAMLSVFLMLIVLAYWARRTEARKKRDHPANNSSASSATNEAAMG